MMKKRAWKRGWSRAAPLIAALVLVATTGFAGEKSPRIELKITGEKEVVRIKDGKKILETVPTDQIQRGDVFVYTVTYLNSGQSTANNVTVVAPIPANTVYVLGSAVGKDTQITFSIDGGKTYLEPPVLLKVKDKTGREIVRPAPPEMFTHIKWVVQTPVHPQGTGTTTFRVKIK